MNEPIAMPPRWTHSKSRCFRTLLLIPLAMMGVACTIAAEGASRAGVTGRISVSNSCPGPQRINQPPCTSVLADAKLVLRQLNGTVASETATTADGSYAFHIPAGSYVLQVNVEGIYPRCPEIEVNVAKGLVTQADVVCDSGMR